MSPPIFIIRSRRSDGADGLTIIDAADEETAIAYHRRHWPHFEIESLICVNAGGQHTTRLYSRFSYPGPRPGPHEVVNAALDELQQRRQAKQEEPK